MWVESHGASPSALVPLQVHWKEELASELVALLSWVELNQCLLPLVGIWISVSRVWKFSITVTENRSF